MAANTVAKQLAPDIEVNPVLFAVNKMPTDSLAFTNQIDEDGAPVTICGQAAEMCCETELERSRPGGDAGQADPKETLTGYKLVEDMMRRQDAVLLQLDELNARVEATIEKISAVRKSEIEAFESGAESDMENADSNEQASDLRRAA